jgi:predicted secreted protein
VFVHLSNKTTAAMNTVTLQMIDELTGQTVSRTIDITNAMSNGQYCWELRGEDEQRKNLNNWILQRGNEQHATILSLISWSFN